MARRPVFPAVVAGAVAAAALGWVISSGRAGRLLGRRAAEEEAEQVPAFIELPEPEVAEPAAPAEPQEVSAVAGGEA